MDAQDQQHTEEKLTTEQMVALLSQPAAAELAYQITQTYESIELVYNASLNVGTSSRSAASTNTR